MSKMRRVPKAESKEDFESQLAHYFAAALADVQRQAGAPAKAVAYTAAAGAALAMAPAADATIIWSGIQNLQLTVTAPGQVSSALIDLDGIGGADLQFTLSSFLPGNQAKAHFTFTGAGATNGGFVPGPGGPTVWPAQLAGGALVSSLNVMPHDTVGGPTLKWVKRYGPGAGQVGGNWASNTITSGYIGIRFPGNWNSTLYHNLHSGWIHVELDNDFATGATTGITIRDWAFEDSGGSILTGQIPEPSTAGLALLGAGAVGLQAWRRRKTHKEATVS